MAEKKKKSYLFTKILLVSLLIFIALGLYAYKMIEDEKENSYKNRTKVKENKPILHPPLTQRDKETSNLETVHNDINISLENNGSQETLEGAKYISPEEQLQRESNLSLPQEEEFLDGEIIPEDELHKYEEAKTIPLNENEETRPKSSNPFNNLSLGTPIQEKNAQSTTEKSSTLGEHIGDSPLSPF
ncbi:MAG TPA: hypothetical protein ENK94_00255 [Campylobacterales bacterium]|nr:hypothetical protein [Campylobacterales bacterium]